MNRVRLNSFLVVLAPLVFLAALVSAPAHAQHMYIDTNGDGVHSSADVVNPSGQTSVAIWLDTHHDRDGSLQTCNSHTGSPKWDSSPPDAGLDIFSYDIFLSVTHGTVVWGEFEDKMGFEKLPSGDDVASDDQIHITRFACLGDEKPAGLYKLGFMTVSVGAGTPSIFFGMMVGGDYTCFGTHCGATEDFPNSYVYGIDWFDADGILYGGTTNHEPTFGQPGPMSVIENRTADQVVTANDEDGQWLSFSKLSGPDYVTVSPGSVQGFGVIRAAPQSSDVGTANVVVRVSDGTFWCDRTVPITVRREFELNPQGNVLITAGTIAMRDLHADNPLGQELTFYVASGPSFVSIESRAYAIYTRFSPTARDIGTHTVTLGVTNGTAQDEKSFTVTVARNGENHAPVAIAGGPIQGIVGHPVRLDGSRSSDPDGDRLTLRWAFGDGEGMAGPIVEHRYLSEGDYRVDLTVQDPDLSAVATTAAHIVAVAPARAYLAGGAAAILVDQERDVCVRIEPLAGLFEVGDLDAAKISLDFPATEIFGSLAAPRSITATGFDSAPGVDGDRNGLADQGVVFSRRDFVSMLSSVPDRRKMELTIRGELAGGGRFSAPVEVTVIRRGGSLSAAISPNPLNPVGQLSFVTSRPGPADVKIFDVSGRLTHHAIDGGVLPAGYHEVQVGRGSRGEELPSGIYYYRIETLEGVARGRFAIVR